MSKKLEALGHHTAKYAAAELPVMDQLCTAFEGSPVSLAQKLQTFPRHVRRQDIARFLVKHELFKLALSINGNVVECGVFAGGGLFSWMHFSATYEPYNHPRRILGFDTFAGFPEVHEKDLGDKQSVHAHPGAFQTTSSIKEELNQLARIHDANRPLGHIEKVELIEGDACETIPDYVTRNPSLLISLLYLDFDLYAPTKTALEVLLPRVVKGGVVAFDELNCPEFAGETAAFLETISAGAVELRRFPIDPYISYFIR
jgi:hypothetical protein